MSEIRVRVRTRVRARARARARARIKNNLTCENGPTTSILRTFIKSKILVGYRLGLGLGVRSGL
jgi:hypothetical protein